jgi:very-short-patch-repair endonuclease
MFVHAFIAARGGIVHRQDLRDAGFGPRALRAAVHAGDARLIRRTWFAVDSAPRDLVAAAEGGGRLTCVSLALRREWWMPEGPGRGIHLHRGQHAAATPTSAVLHWAAPLAPVSRRSLCASAEDALAHIATCLPREDALVLWESASRIEGLSPEALRRIRWTTVAARECAEAVTGLSDSGLETIFVARLARWHVRIRQQAVIAGRRVDVLIGDRLIVQLDGFAYHSRPADRRRDLEHDAELVLRGYVVLRFSYAQVMYDWPAVERAVSRAMAAGAHRAA